MLSPSEFVGFVDGSLSPSVFSSSTLSKIPSLSSSKSISSTIPSPSLSGDEVVKKDILSIHQCSLSRLKLSFAPVINLMRVFAPPKLVIGILILTLTAGLGEKLLAIMPSKVI